MAESLGFEDKVQGLMDYYHQLDAIDPLAALGFNTLNPNIFHGQRRAEYGFTIDGVLVGAKNTILFDMGCHGLIEYSSAERGFEKRDLRDDTPEELAERASVLAVLTSPVSQEVRQERAGKIAEILGSIATGQTIKFTEYDPFHKRYKDAEAISFDADRPLFAVFYSGGHISNRRIQLQYDSPITFARTKDVQLGAGVKSFEIPALFTSNKAGKDLVIQTPVAA